MKLDFEYFGSFYNQPVQKIRLSNDRCMSVDILELGGIITSLMVPDDKGRVDDVVLGFDNLTSYVRDRHYFGAMIGRVANRIGGAQYHLDSDLVQVDANAHEGRHCVHGGRFGYHRRVWRLKASDRSSQSVSILLELEDADGEEGFRNLVDVTAVYELNNENCLSLTYNASAHGPTPINMTAHSYFNLLGHDTGSIADHRLELFARHLLEQGEDRIPTGNVLALSESEWALSEPTCLSDMVARQRAFNHSYIPDPELSIQPIEPRKMARLEAGGRSLEIWSNELTLHFYNGHNLDGVQGKRNAVYNPFAGLCLEPKGYVNAINEPGFPCRIIDRDCTYEHRIEYRFNHDPSF